MAGDISNQSFLSDRFASLQPIIILQAASLQSYWETETGTSAWADLLREGGYGITIALQAALVDCTAAAANDAVPSAILFNACYPDAVNPLLTRRKRQVLAGIGNIAILEAAIDVPRPDGELRILAHHYHLGAHLRPGGAGPRIWVCDKEVADANAAISNLATVRGAEMNHITGATAASLLNGILGGQSLRCHVCGPLGLPGGYPVRLQGRQVELDLPAGISLEAAVAFNAEAAFAEGVVVTERNVNFSGRARTALARAAPQLAGGFCVDELDGAIKEFLQLREEMRCRP